MILGQLVVIDAIDDGQVRAFRRRRDEDALRACLEMGRRLLPRGENARAFERDVDAERLVRKLGRIAVTLILWPSTTIVSPSTETL
jgi:hypothetical protein